jgi:phosphoenolpyruvate carboxykinase (ATP)
VLPPIAKLTPAQAMYHFLAGYTAKVAGTERGVTEPTANFSACFGAPFMALHPGVYAKLLGEKIAKHGVRCWLLNTGWTGGPYGTGKRISIRHTRALLRAALSGGLNDVTFTPHPVFKVAVPSSVPDVPTEVLDPRQTWADKGAYDAQAARPSRTSPAVSSPRCWPRSPRSPSRRSVDALGAAQPPSALKVSACARASTMLSSMLQ